MGYNIMIGNAVVEADKSDFPELRARWRVQEVSLPEAPTFPHDEMTGNTNCRYPSYSGWSDFCRAVGLSDLFFDRDAGLMQQHPGCVGILPIHADEVTAALEQYQKTAKLPPGFWDDASEGADVRDPQLARLIWLEFWMQWAVKNCETPAIYNS